MDLPVLTGDCAYNGQSWVRYECDATTIRGMTYDGQDCTGDGVETTAFVNGTCEGDGCQLDMITYCDDNYHSASPTPTIPGKDSQSGAHVQCISALMMLVVVSNVLC